MSEALRKAAADATTALEAVGVLFGHLAKDCTQKNWLDNAEAAVVALRAALAEPEQSEPDGYIHRQGNHWEVSGRFLSDDERARGWTEEPLFAHPPRREPLSDEQIKEMWRKHAPNIGGIFEFAAEVEQYHGIKHDQTRQPTNQAARREGHSTTPQAAGRTGHC